MGRWRPPSPASSPYITRQGADALRAELDELWRRKRPEVTRALSEAAAEGDRSENAEYTYRKKQLGEIDRRIRYLRKRLETVRIIETIPPDTEQVFFGAWVHLEDEHGSVTVYRIVGADELQPARNWISVDSPMARALLRRRRGDEVEVQLPAGRRVFSVAGVRYEDPEAD
jgi:transcription elongation factor GreB